ncbi:MAG: TAXI family TRAP transporter solute-binding subunit [Desulfovibrio fairfieldensis]
MADSAFNGKAPFRTKLEDVRAIARLYPEYLHVVASKDSGVTKLEDFKGKKVSVGARGSGNEVNCRQIFGFYGLDYKNVEPIFLPYGETADQFKDRQLDASSYHRPRIRPSRTSPRPRKWFSCRWTGPRPMKSWPSSPIW